MQLEDLIERLGSYSYEEKNFILRAYAFARHAHKGQFRKSGEPYIIHPVAVGCILAEMHADPDTIAAGLLHDVIEDCEVSKDLLASTFNETVAMLVDGVTKIRKNEVEDSEARKDANLKKIIESITVDIRIFIIKLADRLHNMRTMEYMTAEKQKNKAWETIEVYVHIAYLLGEYKIKNELEDLAFKYAMPEEYLEMQKLYTELMQEKRELLDEVMVSTTHALNEDKYDYTLRLRVKHLYGIYRRLVRYGKIDNIHDLIAIQILLEQPELCYNARARINDMYNKVPGKNKDYIVSPKTNRYRGLHTSIYTTDGTMIQFQFLTPYLDQINQYGITEYWNTIKSSDDLAVSKAMQDEVRQMQFYKFIEYIGKENLSFREYSDEIRSDILSKMIYVQSGKKNVVEMPEKSTVLDYAFRIWPEKAPYLKKAFVNAERADFNQRLENKDRINLFFGDEIVNPLECENYCTTHFAKRKLRSLQQNNNN